MKPILASVSCDSDNELVLWLRHDWTVHEVDDIRHMLKDVASSQANRIIIDGSDLADIDLSAAWTLLDFIRNLSTRNIEVVPRGFTEAHYKIYDIIKDIKHPPSAKPSLLQGVIRGFFIHIGKTSSILLHHFLDIEAFFGQLCVALWDVVLHPRNLRLKSVFFHVNEIGIRAVPIVSLMAFLISIVLGYQGSVQLQRFGANVFTVNLVAISLLREMGVILTSILVAGRSGSAFAAQIGVMQINQETSAMRSFGMDPFERLVLPRIIAIVIALPLLTFIADVIGLLGTLFVSRLILGLSVPEFMGRLHEAVTAQTFMVGLVKAPVFALMIGMVGCRRGLEVRASAEEVGTHTTSAVVQSIFMVVLADAIFSILFTWMNI
jgi:phospholipid/cholesterol/gamma-HCH transport system permease protein